MKRIHLKEIMILVILIGTMGCKAQVSLARYYNTTDLYTAISSLNHYKEGELSEEAFRLLAGDYARDIGLIYRQDSSGRWNDFEILHAVGLNSKGNIDSKWTNPDSVNVIMNLDKRRYNKKNY